MSTQEMVCCHFCYSPRVTEDNYCHGCGVYICESCSNLREMPLGPHDPEDHELIGEDEKEGEEDG